MRVFTTSVFIVGLLACIVPVASAVNYAYPPGPDGTCLDSVTIAQIADTTGCASGNCPHCNPATTDTVSGMRGIIVAFRSPSGYTAFIENLAANDWNGMQCFTNAVMESSSTNPNGLAIGDSVSVRGVVAWYYHAKELTGQYGVVQIIRKINAGNQLPPFRVGTTTDYKYDVPVNNTKAARVANMLVKVRGPLRVARIGPGGGLPSNKVWLAVNADGSAPGDSIEVDGGRLPMVGVNAPTLGAVVDSVQGLMFSYSAAWAICLRSPADLFVQAPPGLSVAYPSAENKLRLMFDKNVDVATAQNTANYSLGSQLSGSTVDQATVVGGTGSVVELTVTDVLPRLSLEQISVQNVGSESCPACLCPQQSLQFYLGVLSCQDLQAPLVDSLQADPCLDKSRFAGPGGGLGERITVRGVVVLTFGGTDRMTYLADAGGGMRSGVALYSVPVALGAGHQYLIPCQVQEYYGMTELGYAVGSGIIDEGPVGVPSPQVQPVAVLSDQGCDPNQETTNAEDYEGVLVRAQNVKVVPLGDGSLPAPNGSFRVTAFPALTDTIPVSLRDAQNFTFDADTGMVLNVNGLLYTSNDRGVAIWPRQDSDIEYLGRVEVGPAPGAPLQLSLRVLPNPGTSHHVSWVLPQKAKVVLAVYDLSGRRVAVLARGEFPAGEYTQVWDGRDASGARVGSGVYFYRIVAGKEVRTLRAVKLD